MDSGNQEDNGIGTADLYSSLNRLNSPQGNSTKEKAAGGDYSQLKQVSSLFVLSVSQVYIMYSPMSLCKTRHDICNSNEKTFCIAFLKVSSLSDKEQIIRFRNLFQNLPRVNK